MSEPIFRIYRLTLRLYPRAYRARYADEHLLTLKDMLDSEPTVSGKLRIWVRIAPDTLRSVILQNVMYMEEVMRDMPSNVKVSGLLTGLLLLPAAAAIFINLIGAAVFHETLLHTWFWSSSVKTVWVFYMPLIACVVGVIGLVYYLIHREPEEERGILARLVDVPRNWPLAASVLLAFGLMFIVLFHDSAHCWLRSPAQYVTNTHSILQCTQEGFLGGKNGK